MVFQSYALYPHMTVAQNMGFSLKLGRAPKAEIQRRVAIAAEMLSLTPYLDRYPRQLSGGQRQRVAMGRAMVRDPKVFLFDEPLSNLDAKLRVQMRSEIKQNHQRLKTTTVYVTHDQIEAMTMADMIVVMNAGRVEQVGSPLDLYRRPANRFVAGFIGSPRMNMLPATVAENGTVVLPGGVRAVVGVGAKPGDKAEIGIRAEHLVLGEPAAGAIAGTVTMVEHLGADVFASVAVDGVEAPVIVRLDGDSAVRSGLAVGLTFDPARAHPFDAQGLRAEAADPIRSAA
jgi:ABC-type sugar transport system ATPase subunit